MSDAPAAGGEIVLLDDSSGMHRWRLTELPGQPGLYQVDYWGREANGLPTAFRWGCRVFNPAHENPEPGVSRTALTKMLTREYCRLGITPATLLKLADAFADAEKDLAANTAF